MTAAIALGSNLSSRFGDPSDNLREALRRLETYGRVTAVSSFHVTDPVGYTHQPRFVNAAALLDTAHTPLALLAGLLTIEQRMGRDRGASVPSKGPRIIDLDLLLMEDDNHSMVLYNDELKLPHPAMHQRAFVLAPLAEIAPKMQHPVFAQSVRQMLAALPTV
ncbi:MAG TPA: 2-amino-4-hydroxy-6-hydroxymethyldihydropteridine diphosphokinase [Acidobacteriaceae bacterium]|jgi:2-amino-4-hydroxy-6-hydroxymethyldihydropteridine diphosphokinase